MENSNKYFMRSVRAVALIAVTTISSNSMAASVWTLTGITDSTNNDSWNLHMISTSNSLNDTISAVYLDNLSDGLVDTNFLLDNINENIRATFLDNGSTLDMAGAFSEFDFPETYFWAWGTQVDSETMTDMSFFMSDFPLYDSAFYNNVRFESSGSYLGSGRINDNYNTDWSMSNRTATLTVSSVPVPAAAWLFGSGLLGLIGVARRKKA